MLFHCPDCCFVALQYWYLRNTKHLSGSQCDPRVQALQKPEHTRTRGSVHQRNVIPTTPPHPSFHLHEKLVAECSHNHHQGPVQVTMSAGEQSGLVLHACMLVFFVEETAWVGGRACQSHKAWEMSTNKRQGEHAPGRWPKRESNPEHSRCESAVQSNLQPCHFAHWCQTRCHSVRRVEQFPSGGFTLQTCAPLKIA